MNHASSFHSDVKAFKKELKKRMKLEMPSEFGSVISSSNESDADIEKEADL